jgi:hypothetical protein
MLQLRTVRASALCRDLSHVRFQRPSLSNRADLAVCSLVSSPHQCFMAGRSDLALKLAGRWAHLSRAIDKMGIIDTCCRREGRRKQSPPGPLAALVLRSARSHADQAAGRMRPCILGRPNWTKTFHMKRLGTIALAAPAPQNSSQLMHRLTDQAARAFDFRSDRDAPDRHPESSIPCKRTPVPPARGKAPAPPGEPRHRPGIGSR